jgi:hypothetical protein
MAMGCKHPVNMIYNTGYRLSVDNVCCFNRVRFKAQPTTATRATNISTYVDIQGDSGGKVSILRGDSIGHCEKRYRNSAVWISRPKLVTFLFMGFDEEWS